MLSGSLVVTGQDAWSYSGRALAGLSRWCTSCTPPTALFGKTSEGLHQDPIHFPRFAASLLSTMGCCSVEFLPQALPDSAVVRGPCSICLPCCGCRGSSQRHRNGCSPQCAIVTEWPWPTRPHMVLRTAARLASLLWWCRPLSVEAMGVPAFRHGTAVLPPSL